MMYFLFLGANGILQLNYLAALDLGCWFQFGGRICFRGLKEGWIIGIIGWFRYTMKRTIRSIRLSIRPQVCDSGWLFWWWSKSETRKKVDEYTYILSCKTSSIQLNYANFSFNIKAHIKAYIRYIYIYVSYTGAYPGNCGLHPPTNPFSNRKSRKSQSATSWWADPGL